MNNSSDNKPKITGKKKTNPRLDFWYFVAPIIFIFFLVVMIPFIVGIYYSFTDWKALPGVPNEWVGFQNYIDIFNDDQFFQSFKVTIFYTVYSVILINIIGLALALLVTQPLRVRNYLRAAFFVPNLIGGLLLGYIWKFIFLKIFPSMYVITDFFFFNLPWLEKTQYSIWSMAIVGTWQLGGYVMVIYVAAIQSIPESLYEAAKIDKAGAFSRLRHITIPLIAPAFTVCVFLSLSYSFKMFDVNVSLTSGDPSRTTELLSFNIYQTAFVIAKFGYAQALSLVFMLLVAVVTLTQVYYSKRRELEL